MNHQLTYADITWQDNTPISNQFGDVYFSKDDALGEVRYVFLEGNNLAVRFARTVEHFTIVETGFGTGLNFWETILLWLKQAPATARLHFISTECYPLSPHDMQMVASSFPQFSEFIADYIAQYPPCIRGVHRIAFAQGRIMLTLFYGDITTMLPQCMARADAWYLDGFAPAKNSAMWNEMVCKEIARLSYSDTTLATFSAAGNVKRALEQVGFIVQKRPGFGHKREMITAYREKKGGDGGMSMPISIGPTQAIVIGAGLAGCFAGYALAKRGIDVMLIEREPQSCGAASGNPLGVLQPVIAAPEDLGGRFHLTGFLYSQQQLQYHDASTYQRAHAILCSHRRVGKTHILPDDWLTHIHAEQVRALTHLSSIQPQSYYMLDPCYYLNPKIFAEQALAQVALQITRKMHCHALRIVRTDTGWEVLDSNNVSIASAPIVVIANAYDAIAFEQTSWLPIQPVRGQLSYIPATAESSQLRHILCHECGYILPANNQGLHVVGASYEPFRDDKALLDVSHQVNIAGFEHYMGEGSVLDGASLDGRVAFRCTSQDHLPCIGPVVDKAALQQHVRGKDTRYAVRKMAELPCYPGLYMSVAHGSRGLNSAPLAGEILASMITQEPIPLEQEIMRVIHPDRWFRRWLKQEKVF